MFCEKCGKQINDDGTFCPYCGSSVSPITDTDDAPTIDNSPVINNDVKSNNFNKKWLFGIIPVVAIVLVIVAIIIVNSSFENKLQGSWWGSYNYDGCDYSSRLTIEKGNAGLEASCYPVVFEGSEIIYKDYDNPFVGNVTFDEGNLTVLISNSTTGQSMKLHYIEKDGRMYLVLDEYWRSEGDPFIDNINNTDEVQYSKIK